MENLVLVIFSLAIFIFAILYIATICKAKELFSNNKSPINMANIVLNSIISAGQLISGMVIISAIILLVLNDKISSDAGLPIISAITGYLVGRTFDNKIVR